MAPDPAPGEGRYGCHGVHLRIPGCHPALGGQAAQARLHSARRGDYRVIYRIDGHRRRVDIVAIEHRSDIYRPRQL